MNNILTMRPSKQGLPEIIDVVFQKNGNIPISMIEVGSYQGESMEIFMNTNKVKSIICIDPWMKGYDSSDFASETDMTLVEHKFDERVAAFNGRHKITKFKGTLDTFITSNVFLCEENHIVDFVYIDACHKYESCIHDIKTVIDKIRPTIAVGGHDYHHAPNCGVVEAVHDVFGAPDMRFCDSSWLKILKSDTIRNV